MKYLKKLTVKEWKKFDKIVDQENGELITAQEIHGDFQMGEKKR